jgi:hypothetical protein
MRRLSVRPSLRNLSILNSPNHNPTKLNPLPVLRVMMSGSCALTLGTSSRLLGYIDLANSSRGTISKIPGISRYIVPVLGNYQLSLSA